MEFYFQILGVIPTNPGALLKLQDWMVLHGYDGPIFLKGSKQLQRI